MPPPPDVTMFGPDPPGSEERETARVQTAQRMTESPEEPRRTTVQGGQASTGLADAIRQFNSSQNEPEVTRRMEGDLGRGAPVGGRSAERRQAARMEAGERPDPKEDRVLKQAAAWFPAARDQNRAKKIEHGNSSARRWNRGGAGARAKTPPATKDSQRDAQGALDLDQLHTLIDCIPLMQSL